MEFGLLGPLAVRRDGINVVVPKGKQRVLLAVLLLSAGHVVTVSVLAEALWGPEPPPSAEATIRNYVKRLRQALGDTGRGRIDTRPPGYQINVDHDELDVRQFEALLDAARTAARDGAWADAARQARASLALWRGEPLTDVESDALVLREVPRLTELRVQAMETRLDADLHLGRHTETITELQRLTAAHPLREHLYSLLMLALYRDGRQAEALTVYHRARDVLIAELGVEPGTELRELHRMVLNNDTELAFPAPAPAQAEPPRAVPRELLPAVPDFTGRSAELRALTRLLDRHGARGTEAIVISAIGGTAGVGKTALAVQWAHHVAGRFPDGQLYVNLRGYDPAQPMPPADALAGFLRSLGVPGPDIPAEADERAARYRSLLADKKLLIVLDNARSADQVRPLLPGTAACTVLVTSRDALAGLVARDGATRLDLDVLALPEAVALLRTLIGPRVNAEPEATAELARQCCRLPLALRVAAELAIARLTTPLAELVSELADLGARLDLLAAGGDPSTEVRVVFSWSYRHLNAETARTFRLIGLHPGPDIDPYAAAALTGATLPRARQALDVLARAHLLLPTARGRHAMHDLLRSYARELTDSMDSAQEQHAALTRLFDHYLHTASVAMDSLFPAERSRRPRIPRPATPSPTLADPAAAREWLDAERVALVSAAGHAAAHGWASYATRLADTVSGYLHYGDYFAEALAIHGHALDAARATGDRAAEATALIMIGQVHWHLSRTQQARDHYEQGLLLFRAAGDRAGEARALGNLGLVETVRGRYELTVQHQQEAVAIYRELGDRFGEARALGNLGLARRQQRRYQEAAAYFQQTLDLCRELGDGEGEALALGRIGVLDLQLGNCQSAAEHLQQSLALFQQMGDKGGEAMTLAKLGEAYLRLGRYKQAARNFEQALPIARQSGDPVQVADALNGLGEVLFQTGEAAKARVHHATALRLSSETVAPLEQARAHSGLAHCYHADGDLPQARQHWQEALTRYTTIGASEADEIRARLATIDDNE